MSAPSLPRTETRDGLRNCELRDMNILAGCCWCCLVKGRGRGAHPPSPQQDVAPSPAQPSPAQPALLPAVTLINFLPDVTPHHNLDPATIRSTALILTQKLHALTCSNRALHHALADVYNCTPIQSSVPDLLLRHPSTHNTISYIYFLL